MAESALPSSSPSPASPAWRPFALMGVVVTAAATCLALAVVHVATPRGPTSPAAVAPSRAVPAPVAATPSPRALPSASHAPAAAPRPAPSPAPHAPVYVVYQGETLSELAGRFGTTVAALVALNHIVDPDLIYPGQRIRVS